MSDLSSYDLTWIAGAFTVLGGLIAGLVGYWLAIELEKLKEHRLAAAKFRSAFAPAIGQIYLARHHGTHDRPDVGAMLKKELGAHAAAIELFRPFARNNEQYQSDWEQYRKIVQHDNATIDTAEWGMDTPIWSTVEKRIHVLLAHANARRTCC